MIVPNMYLKKTEEEYKNSEGMRRRVNYAESRRELTVKSNVIMYTSFHGRGMICSPYAIFLYLKNKEEFKDYIHVWVLDCLSEHSVEIQDYEEDDNVIFVEIHSMEYMWYLSTAKYLINNVTEQNYFVPKEDQVIINTWHGIPLKYLGYDIPDGAIASNNTIRNFLFADYLISSCAYMTNNIYGRAYKMDGIFNGTILESGQPRSDLLFSTNKETMVEKLSKYGVNIDLNKGIILYAPTWRGGAYNDPNIDISKDISLIDKLYDSIDRDKWQILFKPHQIVYKTLRDKGQLQGNIVPATVDANELLSVSDVLITDYSSIFFDYMILERPILFFCPDIEEYKEVRGLYLDLDSLPGLMTNSTDILSDWTSKITDNPDYFWELYSVKKYREFKSKYVSIEDGKACERLVNAIWGDDFSFSHCLTNNKKKLLFHLGGMRSNGIFSSLMNLLNIIDYNKYDVTLSASILKDYPDLYKQINKNVRVLLRTGATIGTIGETSRKNYCHDKLITLVDDDPIFPAEMYKIEFIRCFGDSKFDVIINYSSYDGFWCNVLNSEKSALQIMWMHSDMKEELEKRIINGTNIFEKNLPQVFKFYEYVDRVVGCSKSNMEVNRENYASDNNYSKFTYVHNAIDGKRINHALCEQPVIVNGKEYQLIGRKEHDINKEYVQNAIKLPEGGVISFVTVGRMSPEKNHENLIYAFEKINKKHKNTRLYILGDGPLRNQLVDLVIELDLVGKVILPGNIDNPYMIMKRCQCFILPSLHEGYPIVLLEARTMSLPIIMSDFSSCKDCMCENGQFMIGTEVDSIVNGMEMFINGHIKCMYSFDFEEYNRQVVKEFENVVEGRINEDETI